MSILMTSKANFSSWPINWELVRRLSMCLTQAGPLIEKLAFKTFCRNFFLFLAIIL